MASDFGLMAALLWLAESLQKECNRMLGAYNDSRSHADVLALYDRAIAAAERGEAGNG